MPALFAPYLQVLATAPGRAYVAAVALLLVLILLTRRLGALFFVTAFPATLAHELMHLLVGFLAHGQPDRMRLLPQRGARGYVLGSVTCRNVRWYNGLLIGLAPLLLLPAALALLAWRVAQPAAVSAEELGWAYLIAALAYASLPSWQDLRVAAASSWLLIVLMLAAVAVRSGWLANLV